MWVILVILVDHTFILNMIREESQVNIFLLINKHYTLDYYICNY